MLFKLSRELSTLLLVLLITYSLGDNTLQKLNNDEYDPVPPTLGNWYSIRANITNRQSGNVESYFIEWYDYIYEKQRFNMATGGPPPGDPSKLPGFTVQTSLYRFDLKKEYTYEEFVPSHCQTNEITFQMQPPNFLATSIYQGVEVINGIVCYSWLLSATSHSLLHFSPHHQQDSMAGTFYTSVDTSEPIRYQTITTNTDYYEYIVEPQSPSYFNVPMFCED